MVSYHNSINLLALTEGLLLALYIKHVQVSNNAKKLRGHGLKYFEHMLVTNSVLQVVIMDSRAT